MCGSGPQNPTKKGGQIHGGAKEGHEDAQRAGEPVFADTFSSDSLSDLKHPFAPIGIVGGMARDITEHLQKQGISPSTTYLDKWAQHCPKAAEEHLKAAGGCMKASNDKGISCKMLGTCLGSGGNSSQ